MSGWWIVETKLIYHFCGGRLEVRKPIKRAGGKAVYQQQGWDGLVHDMVFRVRGRIAD